MNGYNAIHGGMLCRKSVRNSPRCPAFRGPAVAGGGLVELCRRRPQPAGAHDGAAGVGVHVGEAVGHCADVGRVGGRGGQGEGDEEEEAGGLHGCE